MFSVGSTCRGLPFFQRVLQRFALATQFPPFSWSYRWLYGLAVSYCRRRLSRIRGVRAVYLRRGLAAGDPVYGLSDIDLLVMVDGDGEGRIAAQVRHEYRRLRRLIPMLGEGELALYRPDQFRRLFEHSPFYRNRFQTGRREWKRLWGEDVFRYLPADHDATPAPETWELLPAWRYLSQELLPEDPRPAYLRRYIAFKTLADAARAALAGEAHARPLSREAALLRAAARYPECSQLLRRAAGWRRRLLANSALPLDQIIDTFLWLAQKALPAGATSDRVRRRLRIAAADAAEFSCRLGREALPEIEAACAELESIERAVIIPRLSFESQAVVGLNPTHYSGATVDAFDLILTGPRIPPAASLRRFNQRLLPYRPVLNAFYSNRNLAVALHPVEGWTVKDPLSAPEIFAVRSTQPLGSQLELAGALEVDRLFEREDSLARRAQSLAALFAEPDVFRLPLRGFFTLFWETGRAAWLAAQEGSLEVPASAAQVAEALARLTPEAADTIRQIQDEYLKELQQKPSEATRYVHWAALYASRLPRRLETGSEALDIPVSPKTYLSISVLVVTRNRAPLLRRALETLARQQRPPDEVVVVDNASTDNTPEVVRSFARSLNVRLVTENTVGIPYARNTALKTAKGEIVTFLDDDCEAEPDWLGEIEKPFLKDPFVGAVGGTVLPIDQHTGVVAKFYRSRMRAAAGRSADTREQSH